eukprot:2374-Heterococcus_DN1.PRE.11
MAITTIGYLQIGRSGFLTLPCICGQISQLFIDGYLQSRWLRLLAKEENAAAPSQSLLEEQTTAATAIDDSNSTQQHATAIVSGSNNNTSSTVDIESSDISTIHTGVELNQRPQVHIVQ